MLGRASDVDSGCEGMAEAGLAVKSVGEEGPAARGPTAAHGTKTVDGATTSSKAAPAAASNSAGAMRPRRFPSRAMAEVISQRRQQSGVSWKP
mmetsp:Transcript_95877/g.241559  ORF Transcript_95877/g.241559 Transcript_95877/m.241559 type:complete len:93 (+) Transcript_95877:393-671(+)